MYFYGYLLAAVLHAMYYRWHVQFYHNRRITDDRLPVLLVVSLLMVIPGTILMIHFYLKMIQLWWMTRMPWKELSKFIYQDEPTDH